jgi:hypothetical protein
MGGKLGFWAISEICPPLPNENPVLSPAFCPLTIERSVPHVDRYPMQKRHLPTGQDSQLLALLFDPRAADLPAPPTDRSK